MNKDNTACLWIFHQPKGILCLPSSVLLSRNLRFDLCQIVTIDLSTDHRS
ncbi:cyclic lactone autoinducer peptide [Sphingobacterium sp. LRF_L2]